MADQAGAHRATPPIVTTHHVDLAAVRDRYQLARMAGTAADDAGEGWDDAKRNAVHRSWEDVRDLHNEVRELRLLLGIEVT